MINKYLTMYKHEFSNYTKFKAVKDIFAGMTVAVISLPLALAYGVSNGVTATAGLLSSIFGGFLLSVLSGGSFQINGATASTIAILSIVSEKYGVNSVFLCGFISGFIILICYILNFTKYLKYIPKKVISGLVTGISLIIIAQELPYFLGITQVSGSIINKYIYIISNIKNLNLTTFIIGLLTIIVLISYPKNFNNKFPASLFLIIVFITINYKFKFNVQTVGALPHSLIPNNKLTFSFINLELFKKLILPSVALAFLLLIKTLSTTLSGEVIKNEHSNTSLEIFDLGLVNILIPFLGCVPSAGSIAATQVSIKAGQQTRLTAVFSSLTLIIIFLLFKTFISSIPLSLLAGILILVAIKMNKLNVLKNAFLHPIKNTEFLITFISTLFFDISIAILLGIFASIIKSLLLKNKF